jgi:hypothetical protein
MPGADAANAAIAKTGAVTPARRIKQAAMNDLWLRAMVLAPSVSYSLSASILGDQDMTGLRTHFVKPDTAVAMTFSNDPQMGIVCEKFTGLPPQRCRPPRSQCARQRCAETPAALPFDPSENSTRLRPAPGRRNVTPRNQ